MKLKIEYIILAVVILGLSAYLLTRQTDRTLYQLPQLTPVAAKSISRIEINGPEGAIVLDRADDGWTIGERKYPADRAKISRMLETISGLSLTAMVSESGDYVRYDLTDEDKISVTAWAGATAERQFDIGKAGPSFRHTFVKLAGDERVYQAGNNFRNVFEQGVEDLRDKVVLSFAASDVREIRLTEGEEDLTLVRQETPVESGETQEGENAPTALEAKLVWRTSDGRNAVSAEVDELLAAVSQLTCEKFISDRTTADFKDPIYTLALEGQKRHRLAIFAKWNAADTSHPAVSSDSAYPFFLAEWTAKQLMPAFTDLLEDAEGDAQQ
jgi:hypothetical protein